MKILVEGSPLFGKRTGVGQYTTRLLSAAQRQDTTNTYTVFGFLAPGRKPVLPNDSFTYKWVRSIPGRVYSRMLKKHVAPAINRLVGNADIYLFPNFVRYPLKGKTKSIVVVYDLSFLLHGEHSQDANRTFLTAFVPGSIAESDHVITISENSKREIMEHYGVAAEKISIVSPAVDHDEYRPRSEQEIAPMREKYQLPKNYILYTGTLEPRKNIVGLLDAYANLDPSLQQAYPLVLTGKRGWLDESITQRLEELSELPIITTGYVPDEDLPLLYSGANLFVYPSLYEGFGMPPLEAMACGVPVITSDNSSLPEVVGDAGITIAADDTKALTEAMHAVLVDNTKATHMRKQGLTQAQRFNWADSGRKLIDLINEVGKK